VHGRRNVLLNDGADAREHIELVNQAVIASNDERRHNFHRGRRGCSRAGVEGSQDQRLERRIARKIERRMPPRDGSERQKRRRRRRGTSIRDWRKRLNDKICQGREDVGHLCPHVREKAKLGRRRKRGELEKAADEQKVKRAIELVV
jgi:hypothetical protein